MPNAYSTKLAKWLNKILKPFIPQHNTVKDTFEFTDYLKNLQFHKTLHMSSLDVKSLFTSVPIEQTIKHILQTVPEEEIPISYHTLSELLRLSWTKVLFSFDNKMYLQNDGMCMGSNLGPTMAAFCMDLIEQEYEDIPFKPILYKR